MRSVDRDAPIYIQKEFQRRKMKKKFYMHSLKMNFHNVQDLKICVPQKILYNNPR